MREFNFDNTPLWMCTVCGRVEGCGETWMPSPICGSSGSEHRAFKILNPAAQRLVDGVEAYRAKKEAEAAETGSA